MITPRSEINLDNDMVINVTRADGMWWEFLRMRLDLLNKSIDVGEIKMNEIIESDENDRVTERKHRLLIAKKMMERTNVHSHHPKLLKPGE